MTFLSTCFAAGCLVCLVQGHLYACTRKSYGSLQNQNCYGPRVTAGNARWWGDIEVLASWRSEMLDAGCLYTPS
ncbi:hypothetical protein ACQKWADRAFT_296372, partial [Trichoderma austrokoningii]